MSGVICLFSGPKHGQIVETEYAGSPKIVFADLTIPPDFFAKNKTSRLPEFPQPKNSVYRRSRFSHKGRPVYIFDGMES